MRGCRGGTACSPCCKTECPRRCHRGLPRPSSRSLCHSGETEAGRGSAGTNTRDTPFLTACLALREGRRGAGCGKGACCSGRVPHTLLSAPSWRRQGAASPVDSTSSSHNLVYLNSPLSLLGWWQPLGHWEQRVPSAPSVPGASSTPPL